MRALVILVRSAMGKAGAPARVTAKLAPCGHTLTTSIPGAFRRGDWTLCPCCVVEVCHG